ncbi:hypothetical protein OH492_07430 [Vibrio chagasii]|nr:hypothetical protein [Vibrio chagasii]
MVYKLEKPLKTCNHPQRSKRYVWLKVLVKHTVKLLTQWFQKSTLRIPQTHNAGVFDIYTPDILKCRVGVLTGLPDAYGRGRITGDYRRVALYGIDFLMKDKQAQFASLQEQFENGENLAETMQLQTKRSLLNTPRSRSNQRDGC